MKPRLVEFLACPACRAPLALRASDTDGAEVIEGELSCEGCGVRYPVVRGVPRLLPPKVSAEQERTAAAFGYEWTRYVELHPEYEEQFLDWLSPVGPGFFEGKVVLDAGCGIGRHMYYSARYGSAEVVGLDLSDAVETAFRNVGRLPNAHVLQGDILNPPFRSHRASGGDFDFIYSIGVLHHLPDPKAGFESLLRFLKPGADISAWVYGHENNAIVHNFVNPLRRHVTSRLPHAATQALSWPLAVVLHLLARHLYAPLRGTRWFRHLPSAEYIASLGVFGFRQNYSIVFDHLVAPTAHYLRRSEFEAWFTGNGLEEIAISWRNQNSWRGRGRTPVSSAARC